jgi:hypothetical protein
MTARSIRRAQERKEKKLARKVAGQEMNLTVARAAALPDEEEIVAGEPEIHEPAPLSLASLAANRANAQLSTGPRTAQGKARSALNAVKSALTGRTVLLPTDDVPEFQEHCASLAQALRPSGREESELVQSIADSYWRLRRIGSLEMAIFAQGRLQFAAQFENHPPAERSGLIELHTFLHYQKQLSNLQLQEARLRRHRDKDLSELRRLQKEREQREKTERQRAANLYLAAQHDRQSFDPAAHGFEFSIADIETYVEDLRAANLARLALSSGHGSAQTRQNAA